MIARVRMNALYLVCQIRGHRPSVRLAVQRATDHRQVSSINLGFCGRCGRDVQR